MNLPDELERLAKLRQQGLLSEEEFAQAKGKLLQEETAPRQQEDSCPRRDDDGGGLFGNNTLGSAANRYVSFQIIMGVVGLIVFLIMFFTFFLPHFNSVSRSIPNFNGMPGMPGGEEKGIIWKSGNQEKRSLFGEI